MVVLCVLVRIALRFEIGRLHARTANALKTLKERPRTRIRDAVGMLPANIGRDYRLQALLQPRAARIEQAFATLSFQIRQSAPSPGENLTPGDFTEIFDYCTLHPGNEHNPVQEWIVGMSSANHLKDHLFNNYFDIAGYSEEAGDIGQARMCYSRFLKLMHILTSQSDIGLYSIVQQELSTAEIRLEVLHPKHFFNAPTFGYVNREDPRFEADMQNEDPAIRGLAILSFGSLKYRNNDYPGTIAFLQKSAANCGPLGAECLFLLYKAEARESESESSGGRRSPGGDLHIRSAIEGFRRLWSTLPPEHYLRRHALLWMALAQGWSGNRGAELDLLHQAIRTFPNTDLATIAGDVLGRAGESNIQ
jgi:hypothetical protein